MKNINSFETAFHDFMSAKFHFMYFMFQVRKMAPSTSDKVHLTLDQFKNVFLFTIESNSITFFKHGASKTTSSDKQRQ